MVTCMAFVWHKILGPIMDYDVGTKFLVLLVCYELGVSFFEPWNRSFTELRCEYVETSVVQLFEMKKNYKLLFSNKFKIRKPWGLVF